MRVLNVTYKKRSREKKPMTILKICCIASFPLKLALIQSTVLRIKQLNDDDGGRPYHSRSSASVKTNSVTW